jgi:ribosome-binding factor A
VRAGRRRALFLIVTKKKRHQQRSAGGKEAQRGPSQRQLRVGEELRHALAKILREGQSHETALENASVTVSEIRMSADLRNATAFVMPLAGANATEVVAALQRSAPVLKGLLAREVPLRYTPTLVFALDRSFDEAERIQELLSRPKVMRDLQPQVAQSEARGDEE